MAIQPPSLMEHIISLCKRRGFVFPGSDIYGGLANSWDYGPLGVELKNNIRDHWWKRFVHARSDVVGLDSSIFLNSKVWEASGHVSNFNDPLVDCKACKNRFRADHLVEDNLKESVAGLTYADLTKLIQTQIKCPVCGKKDFTEVRKFNQLFETQIGVLNDDKSKVYLRGETAQGIFINFKNILNSSHVGLPFGVAQVGKAFRNEITPGNFIFRTLEFEQMELEYFVYPKQADQAFEDWLEAIHAWLLDLGIRPELLHRHEIDKDALAHYAKRNVDIEFDFPFGQKELYGLAYRTDFDLKNHMEKSGQDLTVLDPETNQKVIPHVIEPAVGLTRTLLAVLTSAYTEESVPDAKGEDSTRVVLKLHPKLAPYKAAVLPLSKKEELQAVAQPLYQTLIKSFACEYDQTQSIGKRYRRQDEIGTPYCITVDFESINDKAVTIRDRDTMQQVRIPINQVEQYIKDKLA